MSMSKRIPPTSGKVPLANLPLLPASQLDFSFGWQLVGSISSQGVTIKFSNLAGDTDKLYMLVFTVKNPSASNTYGICVRFNDDTTTTGHYAWIYWLNEEGTVSTSYKNLDTLGAPGVKVGDVPKQAVGFFRTLIYAEGITYGTNTYVLCVSHGFNNNGIRYGNYAGEWLKQDEITSIMLYTSSGTAVDWKAYLFKPKW